MWAMALALGLAGAQEPTPTPTPQPSTAPAMEAARAFEERARRTDLAANATLLAWSVGNLAAGGIGWAVEDDPEWIAFHQMNMAWNTVNLALAIPGLVGAVRHRPADDLAGLLRSSNQRRLAYGINAGLDVGWMMSGVWLWERGLRTDDPMLVGFGRSMLLQGAALLIYDLALVVFHGVEAKRFLLGPARTVPLGMQLTVEI